MVHRSICRALLGRRLASATILYCLATVGLIAGDDTRTPRTLPAATLSTSDAEFIAGGETGLSRRVVIQVTINSRPLPDLWHSALESLRSFHDRNDDGLLSPAEAERLPTPAAIRQMLWNPISAFGGQIGAARNLDADADSNISARELADWYRQQGIGPVTIAAGATESTARTTMPLMKAWDIDADGILSLAELRSADQLLARLDVNADELLTPDELIPGLSNPVATATILWSPDREGSQVHPLIRQLPLLWLSHHQDRPASRDRQIDSKDPVQQNVRVAFSDSGSTSQPAVTVSVERLRISLRAVDGRLLEEVQLATEHWRNRFRDADSDNDDGIDAAETSEKERADARTLLEVVNRNSDGRATLEELEAWLRLQRQLAESLVQIGVIDDGGGLFEWLDTNSDGRLSFRELRHPASRDDRLESQTLPQQIHITISRGRPRLPVSRPVDHAPEWFHAMDRNGDGDVSRREFLGPAESFKRLDRSHDGLIAPDEIIF